MQTINKMQDLSQLALPEKVKTALIKHLLEPFQNEAEAKAYWEKSAVQLTIGEIPAGAVDEYTDPLDDNYKISLIIVNNDSGRYYVTQEKPHGN